MEKGKIGHARAIRQTWGDSCATTRPALQRERASPLNGAVAEEAQSRVDCVTVRTVQLTYSSHVPLVARAGIRAAVFQNGERTPRYFTLVNIAMFAGPHDPRVIGDEVESCLVSLEKMQSPYSGVHAKL